MHADDMEQFRKLSRERSEIEPVVESSSTPSARPKMTSPKPRRCSPTRKCANLPRRKWPAAKARLPRAGNRLAEAAAAEGPQRRAQRASGNPRRHRRRRIGAVRRRPVPHVFALRRTPALAGRDHVGKPESELGGYKEIICRIVGNGAYSQAQVRIRRPPRAARAGNRNPGPHSHLGLHRGDHAGSGRGRAT